MKIFKKIIWNILLFLLEIWVIYFFLKGVHERLLDPTLNSDIKYYKWFVEAFPTLYKNQEGEYLKIVYLPYFYWLFLPWYPISNDVLFYYFTTINLIGLISLLIASRFVSEELTIITRVIFGIVGFHLGLWANVETMITAGYIILYTIFSYHKNKINGKSFERMILIYGSIVSFLGFKLIPLIFSLIFIVDLINHSDLRLSLYRIGKFTFGMVLIQLILNSYFFIINPEFRNIVFWIDVYKNQPVSTWFQFLARPSVTIPLVYPIIKVQQNLYKTLIYLKQNNLENMNLKFKKSISYSIINIPFIIFLITKMPIELIFLFGLLYIHDLLIFLFILRKRIKLLRNK